MKLNTLLDLISQKTGKSPKRHGKNYSCRCPAHEDNNPSLSATECSDGTLVVKCHAGCSAADICASLGIQVHDLFPNKLLPNQITPYSPEYYIYEDEDGTSLFRKVRYYKPQKGFKLERWENNQWLSRLDGHSRVLYRLPEVKKALIGDLTICLAEGEKDVETLRNLGFVATTNFDGAGKWNESYTKILAGARVVLFYDYDKAGIKHRDLIIEALRPVVKSLKVVELGFEVRDKHGQDVSDWIEQGHNKEELLILINEAKDLCKSEQLTLIDFHDLMAMNIPEPREFLTPFVREGWTGMIVARTGVGKTMLALEIAYAISSGGKFLDFQAPKPAKVLYIDGEMPVYTMRQRLRSIYLSEELQPKPDHLMLLSRDMQDVLFPSLGSPRAAALLKAFTDATNVIIIDNLSCLFTQGDENDGNDWTPMLTWLLELRRQKKAIIIVHHAGKSGAQRGTSRREDQLDWVINLSRPPGYEAKEGARFILEFLKQRGLYGDDVKTIEATMTTQAGANKRRTWSYAEYTGITDTKLKEARELRSNGVTLREIEEATGISKSKLSRVFKDENLVPISPSLGNGKMGQEENDD